MLDRDPEHFQSFVSIPKIFRYAPLISYVCRISILCLPKSKGHLQNSMHDHSVWPSPLCRPSSNSGALRLPSIQLKDRSLRMCQGKVVGEAEGKGEDAVKKDLEKAMKAQNLMMILKVKTKKLRRNYPIKRKKGHRRRKTKGEVTVIRPPQGVQRKPQRREGHPSWSGHLLLQRKVNLFFVCMLDEFNDRV